MSDDTDDFALRESIIHGLRSKGWPRIEAEEEADRRIRHYRRSDPALRNSQDKGEPSNG